MPVMNAVALWKVPLEPVDARTTETPEIFKLRLKQVSNGTEVFTSRELRIPCLEQFSGEACNVFPCWMIPKFPNDMGRLIVAL
jgi:hypothetical protein